MAAQNLDTLLRRGVSEVIIEHELVKLLDSGKPLRLKQGFDPSCPDIHLGHTVGLRKLRQFQEMGHQVILIVGDWTAQIGDPSGRSATRPMLTADEVRANAETYMKQFFKVVDREKTQVRWQSDWFGKFDLGEVIKLTSKFTVAQMLAREDFNNRYTTGRPIAITELLYPLLQAYDSTVIEADIEFGGTDQKFNCLLGRELQEMTGQTPQQVLLVPLLVGTDGSMKMSKSLGNYIAVDEPANDMYGKVMSIPDSLIMLYFELVTDVPDKELLEFKQQLDAQSINPMLLKKRLAREILSHFHDTAAVNEAEDHFKKVVQQKEVTDDIELSLKELQQIHLEEQSGLMGNSELSTSCEYNVSITIIINKLGLVKSKGEAKRLINQGGIQIIRKDSERVTISNDISGVQVGDSIKVGKRRFIKIVE